MSKIPFNNFKEEYSSQKKEIDQAVQRVLESGWFILGNETKLFEEEFAKYIGTKYCVGVASGTEAIALSLMAIGIKAGDQVITTNMTAFPTITGIMQAGAVPVVVDIHENSALIKVSEIENKITAKTKAILPVHIYGQSCDMDEIKQIGIKYNIEIIEDCAQSTGTTYKENKTGTFGSCAAFSFYPTKNLGAYGDAGAITTNNKDYYEKLLKLRNYGQGKRYYHDEKGINSRIDELQAAILRSKLKFIDIRNNRRREIAKIYKSELKNIKFIYENPYGKSNYHLFPIKIQDRNLFSDYLNKKGIANLIHYPIPINKQKAFVGQKTEKFTNTEKFTKEILSIPIYPELSEKEINYIIETINEFSLKSSKIKSL